MSTQAGIQFHAAPSEPCSNDRDSFLSLSGIDMYQRNSWRYTNWVHTERNSVQISNAVCVYLPIVLGIIVQHGSAGHLG